MARHLLPIRRQLRLDRETRHAHGRQVRAQPVQMKERAGMVEKGLATRINGTLHPINPKQKQRVLLLLLFLSRAQRRARPSGERAPRGTAPHARRTQPAVPSPRRRIARDKRAHCIQHARPALPAGHGPRAPKEVSAHRGRRVDARDEGHEPAGRRIAERNEPQMRQRHRAQLRSFRAGGLLVPYSATVLHAEDLQLRHRPQRLQQLRQRHVCARRELRDAPQQPKRRANARVRREGQAAQVWRLVAAAAEEGRGEGDGRPAAVVYGEGEGREVRGGAAEAAEDVQDVGAEAGEAQGADAGRDEEELGGGQWVEAVCSHWGRGRGGGGAVGAAAADADVDVDGKRGGAFHHGLRPRDGKAWADHGPELAQAERGGAPVTTDVGDVDPVRATRR